MAMDTSCVLNSRQNRPVSTPYGTGHSAINTSTATHCLLSALTTNCKHTTVPPFYLRVYIGTQFAKQSHHTVTALQFFYNEPLVR